MSCKMDGNSRKMKLVDMVMNSIIDLLNSKIDPNEIAEVFERTRGMDDAGLHMGFRLAHYTGNSGNVLYFSDPEPDISMDLEKLTESQLSNILKALATLEQRIRTDLRK